MKMKNQKVVTNNVTNVKQKTIKTKKQITVRCWGLAPLSLLIEGGFGKQ
jgi:hypothetical protein